MLHNVNKCIIYSINRKNGKKKGSCHVAVKSFHSAEPTLWKEGKMLSGVDPLKMSNNLIKSS